MWIMPFFQFVPIIFSISPRCSKRVHPECKPGFPRVLQDIFIGLLHNVTNSITHIGCQIKALQFVHFACIWNA